MGESEFTQMYQILQANTDKPFVDRILNADKYPSLDLGDGRTATHKMAWGEADDKYYVFPTIFYDGEELKEYDPDSAFRQAIKTNDYIEFNSPEEADLFSRRYKALWGE